MIRQPYRPALPTGMTHGVRSDCHRWVVSLMTKHPAVLKVRPSVCAV